MRRNLTSITGYFDRTVPRYLPYEFKHHFRMTKRTFQIFSGNNSSLRSFLTFALRILTAHNLWRHSRALVHVHIENMADLP